MNGLVLEGGGARGSYHVGAVKALRKRHIKIDYVVGTSIGSINGAFVACKEYKKWEKLWRNVTSKEMFGVDQDLVDAFKNNKVTKDILKGGFTSMYQIIKNSGIDTSVLKNMLAENIDENKFRKSNINFGLATYNLTKRKPVRVFKEDIPKGKLIEYLIASSYLPVFKFQKIIDNSFYLDGGLFDKCPTDMLKDKNLKNIYVVRTHQDKLPKCKTDANIIEIKSYRGLGSIITFNKDITSRNILLGYYDTLRQIDNLDGKEYYFKYKSDFYYEKLIENKKIIKKFNKNVLVLREKRIIINIFEEMCNYFDIKRFKIHSIPLLIIRLKLINILKKNNIYSKFIKELRVRL